jgi:hypothetical protein
MSVAQFYSDFRQLLRRQGIRVGIWPMPVEVENPIPFREDHEHSSYDPEYAHRCWRILLSAHQALHAFRGQFIGKCSPVHFFWGGFDLAVTRFNGKTAPPRLDADSMTREGYSHEVISHGWWPGAAGGDAAWYAYAAPAPDGIETAPVGPVGTSYDAAQGLFLLPYETMRISADPGAALELFLQSTYSAAADLAGWDREGLERPSTSPSPAV